MNQRVSDEVLEANKRTCEELLSEQIGSDAESVLKMVIAIAADLQDARAEIERLRTRYKPPTHHFQVGDRVYHPKYTAKATVIAISKTGKKVRVRWDNPHWGSTYVYPSSLQKIEGES